MRYSRTVYIFFIVTIVQSLLVAITIALGFLQRWGIIRLSSSLNDIIPICLFLFVIISVIGIIVGIIALFKKGRSKVMPTVIVVLNGWVILLLFGLIMWAWKIQTTQGHLTEISIGEYGRYEDTKRMIYTDDIIFNQKTDTITAIIGDRFGFRYIAKGNPEMGYVPVKLVWVYPSPGHWDSTSRSFSKEISRNQKVFIGKTNCMGYIFGNNQELIPGIWTFQIWSDGKKYAEKQFVVVSK